MPTMDDTSATTDGVSKTLTTQAGKTIWVTAEPEQKSDEDGGGPNPAGIAAGVVVGILGMVGILAGAFFFYKRQKRKRAEEEYRRAQDINSFVSAAKHPPSEDSRWDGEYMAQRRYSNGSIADDEDYSRRILKVCLKEQRYPSILLQLMKFCSGHQPRPVKGTPSRCFNTQPNRSFLYSFFNPSPRLLVCQSDSFGYSRLAMFVICL